MPVTPDDMRRVAQLASLELDPDDETRLVQKVQQVVEYVDRLQAVDTAGIEPLAHPYAGSSTPMRPDTARQGLPVDEVLANAPDRFGPFFRVPRMIEEGQDD